MISRIPVQVEDAAPGASQLPEPPGQYVPLSPSRRLIGDLLYFARKVPTVPVERRMNVQALRLLRARLPFRPSWCAIFLKAYAQVTIAFPELRRAYVSLPWPH